ncbi:hypothetical protein PCASD_06345 [Puccinia coronata f. sp. avenae]|uniref:Uncharacterized protein n=1 Tax=Puccinia coronata f. sp. avenae TaxID=200324 RepID=A0A2N5V901_9BASI|nr:hypothetical protein PCASD_06345 [Puccinia coronata f. sp. avenae]
MPTNTNFNLLVPQLPDKPPSIGPYNQLVGSLLWAAQWTQYSAKTTSKSASTGKFNPRGNSRNHHHSTGSEVRALARYQLPTPNHGIPETQHFTDMITETDSSDKTTLKTILGILITSPVQKL